MSKAQCGFAFRRPLTGAFVAVFGSLLVSAALAQPNPDQHVVSATTVTPSCPVTASQYATNGSFTVTVTDGPDCFGIGVYTISAAPVPNSAPDGSTPPFTTVTAYIGFGQGNFLFNNAGTGQYNVSVNQTSGACSPPVNPVPLLVTVPNRQIQHALSLVSVTGAHINTPEGAFTVELTEDPQTCPGTYTLEALPVANSGFASSTPLDVNPTGYADQSTGQFSFADASNGRYLVRATETDGLEPAVNPVELEVEVPVIIDVPLLSGAGLAALGIGLVALGGVYMGLRRRREDRFAG